MTDPADSSSPSIDIERLMADLRRQIEEKKASGLYAADDIAADLRRDGNPWDGGQLERTQLRAEVVPGLVTSPSDGPLLGKALGQVKEQIVRANWRNMADLAKQLNEFHAELMGYCASLGVEISRLRSDVSKIRSGQDGGGLAAIERRLDALSHSLGAEAGESGPTASLPPDPDGLSEALAAATAQGTGTALLLGCGDGVLLDGLGPSSVGIDERPELARIGAAAGRAVISADPLEYLRSLSAGSVSGVIIRHIPEARPVGYLSLVLTETRRVLTADGTAVLVVRFPRTESEQMAFWRDPWRLRPLHPDTASELLTSAGFLDVVTDRIGIDLADEPDLPCAALIARSP